MATLREVLKDNVGNVVKIGGKAGFFFIGKVSPDYESMLKDLLKIEHQRIEDFIAKNEAAIIETKRLYSNRKKTVGSTKEIFEIDRELKDTLSSINRKIEKYKQAKETIMLLGDLEIKDEYESTVDDSLIIIVNCPIIGTIGENSHMYTKSDYVRFAMKYKV